VRVAREMPILKRGGGGEKGKREKRGPEPSIQLVEALKECVFLIDEEARWGLSLISSENLGSNGEIST